MTATLPQLSSGTPVLRCRARPSKQSAFVSRNYDRRHVHNYASTRDGPGVSGPSAGDNSDREALLSSAARLAISSALVYQLAFNCNAARAEDRPWKPRRHYRRMDERFADTWAEDLVEEAESLREKRQEEARLARLRQAQQREADQKRLREEEEALKRRATEIMVQQQEAARVGGLPFQIRVGSHDLAPLLVWGGILAALAAAYRTELVQGWVGRGRRRAAGGRWVYDRSLGGKKVWVPDSSSAPTASSAVSDRAERGLRDEEFDRLTQLAAVGRTAAAAGAAASSTFSLPAWWDPPPVSYASASTKEAKQSVANAALARLEGSKTAGRDYELSDIRDLRRACQDGHVTVRPKTTGGRESIFRTAVEAAAEAAQRRDTTRLDGANPCRWVAAVAGDLGMEDQRAVTLILAVATSATRARLLDAVTSLRAGHELEMVQALARLAALNERMPVLQRGSKEVDFVYSSLRDRSTLEERQRLWYLLAQLHPDSTALSAELLGFDADRLMQELQDELAAAQLQAEAETEGGPQEGQEQQQSQASVPPLAPGGEAGQQQQQQVALEVVEAREVAGAGEQAGPTVMGSVADAEASRDEGPGGKQGSSKK